jgi:PAS domain S-box-containing protein
MKKTIKGRSNHVAAFDGWGERDTGFGVLFANNPIPMWVYDPETLHFLKVNESAQHHYGYTEEEFLRMKITDIRPEEDVPSLFNNLNTQRPSMQFSGEWRHKHKNGEIKIVEIASHTFHEGGKALVLVMVIDITERKKTELHVAKINGELESLVKQRTAELEKINEELRKEVEKHKTAESKINQLNKYLETSVRELEIANNEMEAFGYSVSHDLHAPLRAIHGYTGIIASELDHTLTPDIIELLDSIQSNASFMGQLIDDLLALARLGKKELNRKKVDMTSLAKESLEELRSILPPFHQQITIHTIPPAFADQKLMLLVFTNLFSNAIKYSAMKEGAVIEVGSISGINNETIYYMKDNGCGFDMKYYPKLFGVFQRLHSRSQFEGTGMGLVLIKRILNKHGGRIWGESELNEGATFFFTLPEEGFKG